MFYVTACYIKKLFRRFFGNGGKTAGDAVPAIFEFLHKILISAIYPLSDTLYIFSFVVFVYNGGTEFVFYLTRQQLIYRFFYVSRVESLKPDNFRVIFPVVFNIDCKIIGKPVFGK